MAIVQKWQHINIRSLWLHIIFGVIAAGSGLSVCVPASSYSNQSISFSTIHRALKNPPFCCRTLSLNAKRKETRATPTFLEQFSRIPFFHLFTPIYQISHWISAVKGTRSSPVAF